MISKFILLAALVTSGTVTAQGKIELPEHFVRVPMEGDRASEKRNGKQDEEIRALKTKLKILEEAVRQLQEEIYWIRYANDSRPVVKEKTPNAWFCSVKSSFDKTYTGQGGTRVEARAKAMESCEKAENGMHCKDEKTLCEKED